MPFSFNPFTGQLDYTDPNIVSGVAASLAYLSGNVAELAQNTANLEADQLVLTTNLTSLQAQYNTILIDPIITDLQSNTINNRANTTILFSSIAAANVEIANNTTHITDLYANSANQQAEIQGLTVSINTVQNSVANNLANIVNNYTYAGNNAAEILLLQANAVNLTANVVQAENDIANNAANVTILQGDSTWFYANAVAQENRIIGLTTDAADLRMNVVNVELDTSNNANAIAELMANSANLLVSLTNTINVSVDSSNAIANLVSNVVSLESITTGHTSDIVDLWAANTATHVRIDTISGQVTGLPLAVSTMGLTIGDASSAGSVIYDLNELKAELVSVNNEITSFTAGFGTMTPTALVGFVNQNYTNAQRNSTDFQDLKRSFTSDPNVLLPLQGPFANNTVAQASPNNLPDNSFYYDSNGFVRFIPAP